MFLGGISVASCVIGIQARRKFFLGIKLASENEKLKIFIKFWKIFRNLINFEIQVSVTI